MNRKKRVVCFLAFSKKYPIHQLYKIEGMSNWYNYITNFLSFKDVTLGGRVSLVVVSAILAIAVTLFAIAKIKYGFPKTVCHWLNGQVGTIMI